MNRKYIIRLLILMAAMICFHACGKNTQITDKSSILPKTDTNVRQKREETLSSIYKTATIGSREWMVENLNVDHYRNGDLIPEIRDFNVWDTIRTGAWCYYYNDSAYGNTYGKLYNWYAVNDPRGLAPEGCHIPSTDEWIKLTEYLGGEKQPVENLKIRRYGKIQIWEQQTKAAFQRFLWVPVEMKDLHFLGKSVVSGLHRSSTISTILVIVIQISVAL